MSEDDYSYDPDEPRIPLEDFPTGPISAKPAGPAPLHEDEREMLDRVGWTRRGRERLEREAAERGMSLQEYRAAKSDAEERGRKAVERAQCESPFQPLEDTES